jgi:predicted nucleic acid-binding protein
MDCADRVPTLPSRKDEEEMSEATAVMGRIDPDDSEFIALALKLGAQVWSYDGHFKQQSKGGGGHEQRSPGAVT